MMIMNIESHTTHCTGIDFDLPPTIGVILGVSMLSTRNVSDAVEYASIFSITTKEFFVCFVFCFVFVFKVT